MQTITSTNFQFHNTQSLHSGKVRDVYHINNTWVVMIATDRISAFDKVLPHGIPHKGRVLNGIAASFLRATSDIVPNWLIQVPHPQVSIGLLCEPFKVEIVVRGYLAGHAAREYATGKRQLGGVKLPDGLKENDPLPQPIITPTTKSASGHDIDISREDIISSGIVPLTDYQKIEQYALQLFERGTKMAADRDLILVDTKYEFGKYKGQIYLIDEIHTPDSSRYFLLDGYQQRQQTAEPQKQLSKEFVRTWLISNGFQGQDGQQIPHMSEQWIQEISDRYIELYEKLLGVRFDKNVSENSLEEIFSSTNTILKNYFISL